MSNTTLPPVLDSFLKAVNAGDRSAFIGHFASTGVVDDWGRRFAGHDAILGWSDKEFLGAHGTLTYLNVISHSPDVITLNTNWASRVFTGDSVFRFTIKDDKITEMKISSH